MSESEQKSVLERWLKLHKGVVFKVVRAYASMAMDREDLFQEIAVQLWKSIPSFRGESSETTWIYRIALNTAIKWFRRSRKQNEAEVEEVQSILEINSNKEDERVEWLYNEISRLDPIDRSLTLLLLDDFSYQDMSKILGITVSNVGVKINRIKKYLLSRAKDYDYGI